MALSFYEYMTRKLDVVATLREVADGESPEVSAELKLIADGLNIDPGEKHALKVHNAIKRLHKIARTTTTDLSGVIAALESLSADVNAPAQ
jgi:hypothetical protein